MKYLEVTNLYGDRQKYDLFLLLPSVDQLPMIDQYIIYGRVKDNPIDLEPVRIINNADEALTFCQRCNEARNEVPEEIPDSSEATDKPILGRSPRI